MRVRVQHKDVKLVIPCGDTSDRVERLLADIGSRFENYGNKGVELRIAQLQTSDGYLLHSKDYIKDVIDKDDYLVAVDTEEFMKKEAQFCEDAWLTVAEEDFEELDGKFVQVGYHSQNKIYVKFCSGVPKEGQTKVLRLEVFDAKDLNYFANNGKVLIGSKSDKRWKLEAHFIVVGGIAAEVEVSVKTGSTPHPTVKRIGITLEDNKLKAGALTEVSTKESLIDFSGTVALPAAVTEGPSFPDKRKQSLLPELIQLENNVRQVDNNNVGVGEVNAIITQNGAVVADQSAVKDGYFTNSFTSALNLKNTSTSEYQDIYGVSSAYQSTSGDWIQVSTRVGHKAGSWLKENKFSISPDGNLSLFVFSEIVVNKPQYEKRNRAHVSLPNPLKLRVTIQDKQGRVSNVTVQHANPPRTLKTKDSVVSARGPVDLWLQCDDTELEARLWAMIQKGHDETGDYLEVQVNPSSPVTVRPSQLKEYVWEASQKKTNEVLIGSTFENCGCSGSAYFLVHDGKVFGIKVELKTTTSRAVRCIRMPEFY